MPCEQPVPVAFRHPIQTDYACAFIRSEPATMRACVTLQTSGIDTESIQQPFIGLILPDKARMFGPATAVPKVAPGGSSPGPGPW
jgi:hypothetical protein